MSDNEAESQNSNDGSDQENDVDADDSSKPSKKAKKSFNADALAGAFQTVLRQKVAAGENEDSAPAPILSRRKALERSIEEEEIDRRARRILKAQIRESQDSMHFTDANRPETLNYERSLRKLATRGVVQLFNTIQVNQQKKEDESRLRRQERLETAHQNIPMIKESVLNTQSGSDSQSYFDFLKQQRR